MGASRTKNTSGLPALQIVQLAQTPQSQEAMKRPIPEAVAQRLAECGFDKQARYIQRQVAAGNVLLIAVSVPCGCGCRHFAYILRRPTIKPLEELFR